MRNCRGFSSGIWGQGPNQGVDVHYQAGPPGQEHEDPSPWGKSLFSLPIKESEIIDFFLGALSRMRDYWGNKIGKPHIIPCKVTGCCSSVLVRLIPAPRSTGIISAMVPKKLLLMASIDDCCTATLGNFAKATFDAISKTCSCLTSDLWRKTVFTKSPYQEFTDHFIKTHTIVSMQRTQAAAIAAT
ncbi:40S ribosomal protein S2 [Plecturocebus cupreus]